MGTETAIAWADHTWSPWRGCQHATLADGTPHPGCEHCYAEALSRRNPTVLGEWGPEGTRVIAAPKSWDAVERWQIKAAAAGRVETVFPSLCDPFEEFVGDVMRHDGTRCSSVLHPVRRAFFDLIRKTPALRWLLLTKRPQLVRSLWPKNSPELRNALILYSASDQASFDSGILPLLDAEKLCCGVGLSLEPLLGPVRMDEILIDHDGYGPTVVCPLSGAWAPEYPPPVSGTIGWVIVGGESGPHHRPMEIEWVESIAEQCAAAGVPLFVKQDCGPRSGQQGRLPDRLWSLKQFPW